MTLPAMNNAGRRWVSVATAAAWLDLSPGTVYELFYAKKIPGARVGRSVRIDIKNLDEQLEKQEKK